MNDLTSKTLKQIEDKKVERIALKLYKNISCESISYSNYQAIIRKLHEMVRQSARIGN